MLKKITVITFRRDYTIETMNRLCTELAEALGYNPEPYRDSTLDSNRLNLSITIDSSGEDVLVVQEQIGDIQDIINDLGEEEVDHVHYGTMYRFRRDLGIHQVNANCKSTRTFSKEDYYAS